MAREMIEEVGTFVEVYVKASVEECARRDVKGLYEKAFRGEIKEFTGVSDPYEEPSSPEVRIDTEQHKPGDSAHIVLGKLAELGLIEASVPRMSHVMGTAPRTGLVEPHGGVLVDRKGERPEGVDELQTLTLTPREVS